MSATAQETAQLKGNIVSNGIPGGEVSESKDVLYKTEITLPNSTREQV